MWDQKCKFVINVIIVFELDCILSVNYYWKQIALLSLFFHKFQNISAQMQSIPSTWPSRPSTCRSWTTPRKRSLSRSWSLNWKNGNWSKLMRRNERKRKLSITTILSVPSPSGIVTQPSHPCRIRSTSPTKTKYNEQSYGWLYLLMVAGLGLGSSQLLLLPQIAQNLMLASKVVKGDSKISIGLCYSKSVILFLTGRPVRQGSQEHLRRRGRRHWGASCRAPLEVVCRHKLYSMSQKSKQTFN